MLFPLLSNLMRPSRHGKTAPVSPARSLRPSLLRLQDLEDRLTPTAYTVNVLGDASGSALGSGSGTSGDLRYCLYQAAQDTLADTITFDATVFTAAPQKTITLAPTLVTKPASFTNPYGQTSFLVGAADSITIDGSLGASVPGITLDGGGQTRLFAVAGGGTLQLNNLTLTGGQAAGGVGGGGNVGGAGGGGGGLGGAVLVDGSGTSFTANGCTFVNNQATGGAGGATSAGATQSGGGGGGLGAAGSPAGANGGAGGGVNGGSGGPRLSPGSSGGDGGGGGGGGEGANGTAIGRPGGLGGLGGGGGGGGNFSHGGLGGFGGGGGAGGGGHGTSLGGTGGFGGGFGGNGASGGNGGGGGGGAGLGGAIFSNGGSLTLTNDTFTQNTATGGAGGTGANAGAAGRGLGGAVFIRNGTLVATSSTFSSNASAQVGTDIYVLSDGSGNQAVGTLKNNILGQNAATSVTDFFASTSAGGTTANFGASANNLVTLNGGGANGLPAGAVVAGTNPNFSVAGLADNGGPTWTIALTAGSTAALQTGASGTGVTADQRGISRATPPDLGAFQYSSAIVPPTIGGVSPGSGPATGGTSFTVTGTGFLSGATVTVGGVAATNVVVVSATTITATTPAGTNGAADVVVTNADTGTVTGTGAFTYISAPTIGGVSPGSGPATGGTSFTVTGTGFLSGATVTVGGTAATNVVVVSATTITATTPAGTNGTAADVVVTNTDTGTVTHTGAFTYQAAPTDVSLSNATVAASAAAGTVVGTFGTTDPDAGDTFTYSLVAGAGDTDNARFQVVGGQLQVVGPLDTSAQTSYFVRVRATDSTGLSVDKVFTVTGTTTVLPPTPTPSPTPTPTPGDERTNLEIPRPGAVDPGFTGDRKGDYVRDLYRAILGRTASADEVAVWVANLNRTSPAQVVEGIGQSGEARSRQVRGMYELLLGRSASDQEILPWVRQLQSGVSETDVAVSILTSTEFQADKADDTAFVSGLYRTVLGRDADPVGLSGWLARLQRGNANRRDVARAFLRSHEAAERALTVYYTDYLGRPGDAGGVAGWVDAFPGIGSARIARAFLSSSEFVNKSR